MARLDHLLPLLATAALPACADASSRVPMAYPVSSSESGGSKSVEEAALQESCSVRVVFGSFATGPDSKAMRVVSRLVGADPDVTRVTRSAFGREGEHSLCIETANGGSATRLFDALESAISWGVAAPVTIIGPNGRLAVPSVNTTRNRS